MSLRTRKGASGSDVWREPLHLPDHAHARFPRTLRKEEIKMYRPYLYPQHTALTAADFSRRLDRSINRFKSRLSPKRTRSDRGSQRAPSENTRLALSRDFFLPFLRFHVGPPTLTVKWEGREGRFQPCGTGDMKVILTTRCAGMGRCGCSKACSVRRRSPVQAGYPRMVHSIRCIVPMIHASSLPPQHEIVAALSTLPLSLPSNRIPSHSNASIGSRLAKS